MGHLLSAGELRERFPTVEPAWLARLAATGQLRWQVERAGGACVPVFDEDDVAAILAGLAASVLQSEG